MRLLFTTAPLSGHLFPMVPLAWAARAAGHDVLVATTENFVPAALGAGLPAMSWGPATDFVATVAEEPPVAAGDVPARRRANGRAFGRIARRCLPGAERVVTAWKPDLVISERAELAGPVAAAQRGVPHVQFHWGIPELPEYRAGAAEAAGLGELPEPVETLNPWPAGMRLPHAIDHRGVRATAYNGEARLPDWLLEKPRRPRVCVTFGTLLPLIEGLGVREVIAPVLDRLAGLGLDVLLAVDDRLLAQWPELGRSATVAGRMPLGHVLPTCAAMINHGGQGTMLSALAAGCPQLVLPHMDDQFENAEAVAKTGAGSCLSPAEFTPELVAEQVRALLDDPGYGRESARVASEIAAQLSPVEVVDLLAKPAEAMTDPRNHVGSR